MCVLSMNFGGANYKETSCSTCMYLDPAAGLQPLYNSYFGSGDYSILVGYLSCSGYESQVANCSGFRYSNYIPSYCNAANVAGVRCLGEGVSVGVFLYSGQ